MRYAPMHPLLQWVTGLSMNFFVQMFILFLLFQSLGLYFLYKKCIRLISVFLIFFTCQNNNQIGTGKPVPYIVYAPSRPVNFHK